MNPSGNRYIFINRQLANHVNSYPSKEIAHELGLSPRTVEMHRHHIAERLGVRRASDAIRLAVQAQMQ